MFRKSDGLFYHAKGATPAFMRGFGNVSKGELVAAQTKGIDARFFCGHPDLSELPGAYKNADSVRAQIADYGLAEVVDTIEPVGCIMAGDWQHDAPWRNKKKARMDHRPSFDDDNA